MNEIPKLKILFITTEYGIGGAGIAALRLAEPLLALGHEVQVESLRMTQKGKMHLFKRKLLAKLNRKFEYKTLANAGYRHGNYVASPFLPFNPLGKIRFKDYDLVHIHWINYGFLSLKHINKIANKIPTVWTLHSYWPFSAPYQYESARESLINPTRSRSIRIQNSLFEVRQKPLDAKILWVIPSKHMASTIPFPLNSARTIPNPLPTLNSADTKRPEGYLYLGAGDIFDKRKGLEVLLINWITNSSKNTNRKLTVVGPYWGQKPDLVSLAKENGVVFIGQVDDRSIMELLHVKAYGLFVPSLEETFGQVISEALASGTRVIARQNLECLISFVGLEEGILKIDFNTMELEKAFAWCEDNPPLSKEFVSKARQQFDGRLIAQQFVDAYREII